MKRIDNRKMDLNKPPSNNKVNLNQLSTGCAPCLNEALKIDKKINGRSLNEIKINEIKKIVKSIFESSKDGTT